MKNCFPYFARLCLLIGVLSVAGTAFAQQQALISTGAVWRYLDNGTDQGTAWRALSFNDELWAAGPAELGFGDGGEATTNAAGFITYYYRQTFNVGDASSITNLRARLKRDDGAVVYLNGTEVFRSNMPTGEITAATTAAGTAADDGSLFFPSSVPAASLVTGANVVAVEVHQAGATSSDVSFDFELVGNPVPSIAITSPTNTQFIASTSVGISGTAVPGGASVTLVEVFAGATKVGESTNATFNVAWTGVAPGSYVLTAKLTDSSGLRATSAPVSITVQSPPASMLVARGSSWRYNNTGTDLGSSWKNPDYDDSAWGAPLPGPLGNNVEGGIEQCASVINIGPTGARFPVVYYRSTFNASSVASYQNLLLRLQADDSAAVYLNGTLLYSDGVTAPGVFGFEAGQTRGGLDEIAYREFAVSTTTLSNGINVLAVENHQVNATSSDLQFDLELEGTLDTVAPTASYNPSPGSTVLDLTFINVLFSEAVVGVNASDLLINSEPATTVVTNNPNDYTFYFTQPSTGVVQVAWSSGHGIADPRANAFAGGNWTYTLNTNTVVQANIVISEFLADNNNGIKDDDGQRNDWVELFNFGPLGGNLDGWFLTDSPTNLTKWRFPALALNNNNYVLIWCSAKNRTNLNFQLHTNFKLQKEAGGYLALVNARTNIVSVFSNYPAQSSDVSYGRDRIDPTLVGYLSPPTPGAQNTSSGAGFSAVPVFSLASGVYTNASLTLSISNSGVSGTIRYTTDASVPTAASPAYTGPLTLSVNSTIKARIFPPAGTNLLPSTVVARNYIFLDNTAVPFTSKLPTLIISTEGRPIQANVPPGTPRTAGSLVVIDTERGRSSITGASEVHELAGFEIFGQTSAGFAKQPIRVEIQDAIGSDLDKGFLGMPADSDWRLRNPYNDKTLLNDFLGYTMWEDMGHYSVRRRLVEVFVDTGGGRTVYPGDYYGVMMLCETIKVNKDRVDIEKLSPYATNLTVASSGFIFKRDKDSQGDLLFSSIGGPGFQPIPFKLHAPKPNDMRIAQGVTTSFPGAGYTPSGTNQMNYLRNFMGTMERALYTNTWTTQTGTNHYSYYLNMERFADQMLHVEFTKQIDGYRLSDYFTKGRDGKIGPGPVWDWNLSFGNADYAQGGMTNTWYYEITGEQDHPWARRLITGTSSSTTSSGDPEFVQLIADRWSMFRTNVLNGTNMMRKIDELSTLLSEAAARDLYGKYRSGLIGVYTWPNPSGVGDGRDVDYVRPTNYFGPLETVAPSTPSGSIIGQMKKWVLGRYLWMDSQFIQPPTISAPGAMVTNGYTVTVTPPPGATLYYTTDGTDPRLNGGNVSPSASSNNGPVTITVNNNVRVFARATKAGSWKSTWGGPAAETFFTTTPSLRITEIMYHHLPPAPGSTNSEGDYDFIEVKNIGAVPLNVNQYRIGGGIQFQFPNVVLAAGQSAVIVADVASFQARYGVGIQILGTFTGNLNNAGDHLTLLGALQEPILDFFYSDSWYPATDGFAFSLVTVDENAPTSAWNTAANWRPSSDLGGSPGADDPAPPARPAVVVNEVLAHGDNAAGDVIELFNTTGSPADISGWFLTDDFNFVRKYVIPGGTIIPANGHITFNSTTSFGVGFNAFTLGAKGDQAYVFSADGANLTGYAHGFDFGASATNTTFGRYISSDGDDHFVTQSASTLGGANSGPLVGPIIINEISYRPPDIAANGFGFNNFDDEFIELHNISGNAVPLYDVAYPTNRWRLTDAVDFEFSTGAVLPPGGYLLVVGFDPANATALANFRANNFVPTNIPVYGPWSGSLDNVSDVVELKRPDAPDTNSVPYILVERVAYRNTAPWPTAADGLGLTLQRIVRTTYANDPTNWAAAAPTPGDNFVGGGTPPLITSQPGNQTIIFGNSVVVSATATGTEPLRFQWRLNGLNLTGATNRTLTISNFQAGNVGTYNIFVYNSGGAVLGTNFTLGGRTPLQITVQPISRVVLTGQTTNFTVAAVGTGTLRYQWRLNGVNVANATNPTLTLVNIQSTNQGTYTAVVMDAFDTMVSQPATLTIISGPVLTLRPFNMTVVEGSSVTLSVAATGTAPISFRWQTNSPTTAFANISNVVFVVSPSNSTIVVTNISTNFSGLRFRAVLTNIAGSTQTTNAVLTVLADSDRDGLPDVWESGRLGFSPNDPSDGARDDDGDGMTNGQEFFAGTDPFDPTSNLRLALIVTPFKSISFMAVTNRAYTVQFTDALSSPVPSGWAKLGDVLARATNRIEVLSDPFAGTNRFYRLVIPPVPWP